MCVVGGVIYVRQTYKMCECNDLAFCFSQDQSVLYTLFLLKFVLDKFKVWKIGMGKA